VNYYTAVPRPVTLLLDSVVFAPVQQRRHTQSVRFTSGQLRVRIGILNAYHLPGVETGVLYPTISPVNSFRVVLNAYFGTKLPLLPDRTIRHVSDFQPFIFDDVTSAVTMAGRNATGTEPATETVSSHKDPLIAAR
jgi:hypothetical protein